MTDKKLDIQDCKNAVAVELVASVNLMIDAKKYSSNNAVYTNALERYRKEAAEYATILMGLKSIY